MKVVAETAGSGEVLPPFHDHDVREWSRIDSITGVLEKARMETDQWTAFTNNSSHKYGKVVDSRARTNADGGVQQRAKRQLEVYQSQVPGGQLQVIKTHLVSSSRWRNQSSITDHESATQDFENLEISLNPLDLSSQKSKASVGRSIGKRPPSRPRLKNESPTANSARNVQQTAATNLSRVSRLCHQVHDDAVKRTFGKYFKSPPQESQERQGVIITEIGSTTSSTERDDPSPSINGKLESHETKSTSNEDIHLLTSDKTRGSIEHLNDLDSLQNWRRTSKIRRSLQYPKQNKSVSSKPPDLPENSGSVSKIREELEKGRRLSTALRGNRVNLEALDHILQSVSSSSSTQSERGSSIDDSQDILQKELESISKKAKRNSFVTVESLQEVKGRLRRTSTPTDDDHKTDSKSMEPDDGIVTELNTSLDLRDELPAEDALGPTFPIRSYIYGMEAAAKKPVSSTGSLESRSKVLNGNSCNRTEDWYNRRKSYGFEEVHNAVQSRNTSVSLRSKNRMESSTDSGICKSSTEFVSTISPKKEDKSSFVPFSNDAISFASSNKVKQMSAILNKRQENCSPQWERNNNNFLKSTTIKIPIIANPSTKFNDMLGVSREESENKRHSIAVDEAKYVTGPHGNTTLRPTSVAAVEKLPYDILGDSNAQRKSKKVEFCKTEVHFAAESGRVNIVETDEKPPPTNNFRRRRKNSVSPVCNNNNVDESNFPVLHFGDSSYEKSLLLRAKENESFVNGANASADESSYHINEMEPRIVTVNKSFNESENGEDSRLTGAEADNIKSILKNKPVKPIPYHLGEIESHFLNNSSNNIPGSWKVNLKPTSSPKEAPYWKSTVMLSNTVFGQNNEATNSDADSSAQCEFQKRLKDLRPTNSFKSGALDEQGEIPSIKLTNENGHPELFSDNETKWTDSKLFSTTKINFSIKGATSVESDHLNTRESIPMWSNKSAIEDFEQELSQDVLVKPGGTDFVAVAEPEASHAINNTTKTKININLNRPLVKLSNQSSKFVKTHNVNFHNFKSTSLILDTIKNTQIVQIPQQLEALKKLYEGVQSDSEADEEMTTMKRSTETINNYKEDETSSVVSGSWSRMKSYKTIGEHANKTSVIRKIPVARQKTKIEKDVDIASGSHYENDTVKNYSPNDRLQEDIKTNRLKPTSQRYSLSPTPATQKVIPTSSNFNMQNTSGNNNLFSPYLVGKNLKRHSHGDSFGPCSQQEVFSRQPSKSPPPKRLSQYGNVLRQPKKSEMVYFGIAPSPKQSKKKSESVICGTSIDSEKPDLLQHVKTSIPAHNSQRYLENTSGHMNASDKQEPIYENVNPRNKIVHNNANVLEELTQAIDRTAIAVDDSAATSKTVVKKTCKKLFLDESSADTSEKRTRITSSNVGRQPSPAQLKHKSSPSRECRKSSSLEKKQEQATQTRDTTPKKNASTSVNNAKIGTKARRLQRASSREALLHSHGSSSEDLGASPAPPQRKPRQVKKTKAVQLTVSNGIDIRKKRSPVPTPKRRRDDAKRTTGDKLTESMPEVRRKSELSTIKTLRAQKPNCDQGKHLDNSGHTMSTSENKENSTTGSRSPTRSDPKKRTVATETVNHRISTAYVPVCKPRSPNIRKTQPDECPCICS